MQGKKGFRFIFTIFVGHLLCFELQGLSTLATTIKENISENEVNDTTSSPESHHHRNYDHSSDNAINEEHSHKTLFSGEQGYNYLLPEQTIFDSPEELIASMVISTSPPKLTIKPSPVQQSISYTSAAIGRKNDLHSAPVTHSLPPEACISETPTFPFVASSFSSELKVLTNKEEPMYGRIETASSTESANSIAEDKSEMSQPSTFLLHGANAATNTPESKR